VRSLVFLALAACATDGTSGSAPTVESSNPPFAPLSGGTRITLTGTGFLADGAAPNRVVIGGREAPQSGAIDDQTLEIEVPPGDQPGPADIIVFNRNGQIKATGVFHYSTQPEVASVTPANVVFTSTSTNMTVSGSGFKDENAGHVNVLVDGMPAIDVVVLSDTELTFTALPGQVLTRPTIEVVNDRGAANRPRAFRYTPGPRGGLLLFPDFQPNIFAIFFDPVDSSSVTIQRNDPNAQLTRWRSVFVDADSEFWTLDQQRRLGRLDMKTQQVVEPAQTNVEFPALVRKDSEIFVLSRSPTTGQRTFGVFDPVLGSFSQIGTSVIANGSNGIAIDGTGKAFVTQRTNGPNGETATLSVLDLSTGTLSGTKTLTGTPNLHITEMRFFGPQLFATTRDGQLVLINTVTGGTSVVKNFGIHIPAMEVFQ
jgi:hypothetical protein